MTRIALLMGLQPASLELHPIVSPLVEPARVAVGVVLDADHLVNRQVLQPRKDGARIFGHTVLVAWFVQRLSQAVGAAAEPLRASPDQRAAQAARLMLAGLSGAIRACSIRPAVAATQAATSEPRRVRDVKATYLSVGLRGGSEAEIRVGALLTEHGTATAFEFESPASPPVDFRTAVLGAASLWRFVPPMEGGCPALMRISLRMTFTIG